jgi:hypothetical protein
MDGMQLAMLSFFSRQSRKGMAILNDGSVVFFEEEALAQYIDKSQLKKYWLLWLELGDAPTTFRRHHHRAVRIELVSEEEWMDFQSEREQLKTLVDQNDEQHSLRMRAVA